MALRKCLNVFMINKPDKKEIIKLMIAGCLAGILCFGMIYGFKVVNVTYDDWIFYGDYDLMQHYTGFCHFRTTPWHFPIGLTDSLSVPYSMSVVYTDSIPLFAIIFKLLSAFLPVKFQYLGLFGLMSYMLMGALSPVLIRRFTDRAAVCISGSLFFILSFPMMQRMFYHTALTAQWIIVLALIIWFYSDITDMRQNKKLCIIWALMGALSVTVHSYFVFMTGIILLANTVEGFVRAGLYNRQVEQSVNGHDAAADASTHDNNYKKSRVNNWIYMIYPLISMGAASFITLYILGGFYGKGSVSGDGFGSFNGNLSAYINPLKYGTVFNGFENNGMFEYEGFAYLGAGVLLILVAWAVFSIYNLLKPADNPDITSNVGDKKTENTSNTDKKSGLVSRVWKSISVRKKVVIFTVIFVLIISCFPKYSIGKLQLISLPVPGVMARLLGICRTNARFVWVGMYLLMAAAMYFVSREYDKKLVKLIFAIAIIVQIYDVSGYAAQCHEKYSTEYTYESEWDALRKEGVFNNKKRFVFMYRNDDNLMMDTAYYGYMAGMSQNCFYYARTIYNEIEENIIQWNEEFMTGKLRDDCVYIIKDDMYDDDYKAIVEKAGAKEHHIPGNTVITLN